MPGSRNTECKGLEARPGGACLAATRPLWREVRSEQRRVRLREALKATSSHVRKCNRLLMSVPTPLCPLISSSYNSQSGLLLVTILVFTG